MKDRFNRFLRICKVIVRRNKRSFYKAVILSYKVAFIAVGVGAVVSMFI